jgi:hypothetical protein
VSVPNDLRRRIVDGLFGGWPERTPLHAEVVDTLEREDCAIELLAYWSEDGVPVPALLFRPRPAPAEPSGLGGAPPAWNASGRPAPPASRAALAQERMPAVVYTSPAGKARAPELRAVHEMVRAGMAVLAIDFRGQGETAGSGQAEGEMPAVERGIMLHRPLFAGRVWDVLRGVEYLAGRPDVDSAAVYVWGERAAAFLALHAVALDDRVAGAACLGLPDSYRVAAGCEATLEPWLVVPGLLAVADVPDLKSLVAPRPLVTGVPEAAADLVARLAQSA